MSVTIIDKPDSTRYVTVTLHLITEADVKEWAEERGIDPVYLPREGKSAALIMATGEESGASVTAISQVYR